jgi:hypothetical protein
MADIYQLCAATVYQDGAFCVPQASIQLPLSDSDAGTEDPVDLGQLIIANALGVTALPAAPNSDGTAEGVVVEGIGGMNGVCVASWDTRCADVAGEMSNGDTCLHGTHSDATKRAKVFCKENHASMVVGKGVSLTIDANQKTYTFTGFGCLIQCSETGIKIMDGGTESKPAQCWIELKGGTIFLVGKVIAGGAGAVIPVMTSASLPSACFAVTA